jgi:hypothetical protein
LVSPLTFTSLVAPGLRVLVACRASSACRHVPARHRAAVLMLVMPAIEPGWERLFLAGVATFVNARAAHCPAPCPPARRHEHRHAGRARTPACVAAEQSR